MPSPSRTSNTTWSSPRHRRSVRWVVTIATLAILFDGYDLVVYGTVLPVLMNDPGQLGELSAQEAGMLGSYALIGVMVGALLTGAIGDYIGRRKAMLVNVGWFSVGMALAATSTSIGEFGFMRFLTGIGIGGLLATVGAMIAEFAPAGKRNLYNALVYSGFPVGGILASIVAIVARDQIGWRGLFWIGALPILTLLPLAFAKLPESPRWLISRGRENSAHSVSEKTGIPLPSAADLAAEHATEKVGYAALATRRYAVGTALLGIMSFTGLMLTYGLTTWLPKIMENAGYNTKGSLWFLVVLNGGAVVGTLFASRLADLTGPQRVVASTFALAALALVLFTMDFPLPVLLTLVAVAGIGTIGTQVLIYGFVANYYATAARAAGVAWCAGFGRLGGIFGPLIGGLLIGAGIGSDVTFYIFAGVALIGTTVTFLVPHARHGASQATLPRQTDAVAAR